MAIPTILGALVFLIADLALYQAKINISTLVVGFVTSSIVAFLTIKYFLIFVEKIGMYPFVIYRLLLGFFILASSMTFPVFIENDDHYQYLTDELKFSDSEIIKTYPEHKPFFIFQEDGLHFAKDSTENKLLHIDFLKGSLGWRLKRRDHETLLKKALGKKNKNLTIFDGTAGFLSDTLIFLALGHKVIACEQSRVLFLLLSDAINRAKIKLNFLDNLNLIHGDALDI